MTAVKVRAPRLPGPPAPPPHAHLWFCVFELGRDQRSLSAGALPLGDDARCIPDILKHGRLARSAGAGTPPASSRAEACEWYEPRPSQSTSAGCYDLENTLLGFIMVFRVLALKP